MAFVTLVIQHLSSFASFSTYKRYLSYRTQMHSFTFTYCIVIHLNISVEERKYILSRYCAVIHLNSYSQDLATRFLLVHVCQCIFSRAYLKNIFLNFYQVISISTSLCFLFTVCNISSEYFITEK